MKTCYTVILGGYDTLRNPEVITPGWRYFCITDTPEICQGTVYNPFYVTRSRVPELRNRFWKWRFLTSPSVQSSIMVYHDGNFQVIGNLDEYIKPFENKPFATRPHPSRDNLLDETQACLDLGKITASQAAWVVEQLEDMVNLPNGLWENGLLYFNPKAEAFDEWDGHFWHLVQMLSYCNRDQILLPMVLENETTPATIDRNHAANYFKYHKTHLK